MSLEEATLSALEQLAGPWCCRWTEDDETRIESLRAFIENGKVNGIGLDREGIFEFRGSAHAGGTIILSKTYSWATRPMTDESIWFGRWDGLGFHGEWISRQDPQGNHGPFHLWPEHSEQPGLEAAAESPLRPPQPQNLPPAPWMDPKATFAECRDRVYIALRLTSMSDRERQSMAGFLKAHPGTTPEGYMEEVVAYGF